MLVVAGHDPTGGAGVDADREAVARHGGEARCVVTAWTRQGGGRVDAVGARDPGAWLVEARAALFAPADRPGAAGPDAVKAGLLPGAAHVAAFARLLGELPRRTPVVVDPVLAASGGEPFLDAAGVAALAAELLPAGCVLTPNLPEAARLGAALDAPADPDELARSLDARVELARRLLAAGAEAVVLKGGHGALDPVRDLVLAAGGEPVWLAHPRAPGGMHGSGCRFASALAAGLGAGLALEDAARRAGEWVAERIAARGRDAGG